MIKIFKKPKKSTLIKILVVIILSILLTLLFGHIPHTYFHDFSKQETVISPYDNPTNEEYLNKFNSLKTTLLPNMTHVKDYLVLNGGGTSIVGATRVFEMTKNDFENITFQEYIKWTEENFDKYECKTKEELEKDILCILKGYIVFEDGKAIKHLNGHNDSISVNKFTFNYLNGFSQDIVQERRTKYNSEKPSFYYLNKDNYKDYEIIDSIEVDNEEQFNEFKNYILK